MSRTNSLVLSSLVCLWRADASGAVTATLHRISADKCIEIGTLRVNEPLWSELRPLLETAGVQASAAEARACSSQRAPAATADPPTRVEQGVSADGQPRRWTDDDLILLRRMAALNVPPREMAERLGRTVDQVRYGATKAGIRVPGIQSKEAYGVWPGAGAR